MYSKDGYLFEKESILEYTLAKKKEYARKLKEYEKQKKKQEVCYQFCQTEIFSIN